MNPNDRRAFLRQAGCAALGATGLVAALDSLRGISALAAGQGGAPGDYKALVCVFLYGGNDANNLLVPWSPADYAAYEGLRQNLALKRDTLLPIVPATGDGRDWALHPSTPELRDLFNAGDLAIVANVGTLVAPVTRQDWLSRSVALPPQLFSHNDQATQWQTGWPDQTGSLTGWGGRLADLTDALNHNNRISMSVSLDGNNTFQIARNTAQYQLSPDGAPRLTGFWDGQSGEARRAAMRAMYDFSHSHLLQQQFADISADAIDNNEYLQGVLDATPPPATAFPDGNELADQLRMVAHLIKVRDQLDLRRQVFFVAIGGYDTHEEQLAPHAELLRELSQALHAFHAATVELGVADQVTAFTASDFGRTYTSNGKGSDHGWGSQALVVGGAVRGGDIHGRMPILDIGGPDDTDSGRWIPTIAVDEYAATLACWFGVDPANLDLVLPNIGRFANRDLGFFG